MEPQIATIHVVEYEVDVLVVDEGIVQVGDRSGHRILPVLEVFQQFSLVEDGL